MASDRQWLSPAPAPTKAGDKGHDADGSQDAAEDNAPTPRGAAQEDRRGGARVDRRAFAQVRAFRRSRLACCVLLASACGLVPATSTCAASTRGKVLSQALGEHSWEWVVSTLHMRLKGYCGISLISVVPLRRCSAVKQLLLPHGAVYSCTEQLLPLRVSLFCLTWAPFVCRSSAAEQIPTSRQSAVYTLKLLSSHP